MADERALVMTGWDKHQLGHFEPAPQPEPEPAPPQPPEQAVLASVRNRASRTSRVSQAVLATPEGGALLGASGQTRTRLSSILVTQDGVLEEVQVDQQPDITLATLFMTGCQASPVMVQTLTSAWHHHDLDQHTLEALRYFPDPPCVLPVDKDAFVKESEPARSDALHCKDFGTVSAYCREHVVGNESAIAREAHAAALDFKEAWSAQCKDPKSRNTAYVVIAEVPIGVQSTPSVSTSHATDQVIQPGHIIQVDSIVEGEETRFMHMADGSGWVYDALTDTTLVAELKQVEVGSWWYQVVCEEYVEVRTTPTLSPSARSGFLMCPGEVTVVWLRAYVKGVPFLQLADGRGWIFEVKPVSASKSKRNFMDLVAREVELEPDLAKDSQDFQDLIPPTNEVVEVGMWAYKVLNKPVLAIGTRPCGIILKPGEVVRVDKRCSANGNHEPDTAPMIMQSRTWLRLTQSRGWIPIVSETGEELVVQVDPSHYLVKLEEESRRLKGSQMLEKGDSMSPGGRAEKWRYGYC